MSPLPHAGAPSALLVDDEVTLLAATARVLERRGIRVTTAATAEDARAALERSAFDVAVLDARMPDADGHELFYEFRQRRPGTQFIVLTGHGDAQRAFEMSLDGLFAYVSKPCDVEALAALIFRASGAPFDAAEVNGDRAVSTVLLIDDEEAFLASMRRVLARRGFNVLTASGGEAGLALLRHDDVDVAIVDLKMPGLDGLEVLSRIKAEKPLVEVILLTGHGDVASAVKGMPGGAFDYLLKPCDPDELALRIEVAAARKRQAASR